MREINLVMTHLLGEVVCPIHQSPSFRCRSVLLAAVAWAAVAVPTSVLAGPVFEYGDFFGDNVNFLNVRESSGTDEGPLYGAPTLAGDGLSWNPVAFNAFSSGGGAPDLTDGTLAFTIEAHPGGAIPQVFFEESGDYTVAGVGTSSTLASVAGRVFVTIIEVDGMAIAPLTTNEAFSHSPTNGLFRLTDYPFPGVIGAEWQGSVTINLDQVLAAENISGSATRVLISLDNSLLAVSEADSTAFIAKKTFIHVVPEPTSLLLLAPLAGCMALRRRSMGLS